MGTIPSTSDAITIERTIGDDIFDSMSQGLAKDYYTSVIEFISNGHDAGARNFSIITSIDQLVMEDDGRGMDRESIHNFFSKGTDYKRLNPQTNEGRQVLGRFGLATLLLRHLGDAYKLETWREGKKIVVEQDFARDGWKKPVTRVLQANENTDSGTRITITKPRYTLDSLEFNTYKLRSRITWGFPPLPDFRITLNGETVERRGTVAYATEYDATAQISDTVSIAGSIYFNTHRARGRKVPFEDGIILYVNGRRVGDPSDFPLASIDTRFAGNVLGLIDVHGLSSRIRFDRSGFLRTPSYLKIRDYIIGVLKSIDTDLDSGTGYREFYAARESLPHIEQALRSAAERLNAKLKLEGNDQYTFDFDTGKRSGPIARVDDENKVIYINQKNPQLVGTNTRRTTKNLDNILLMAGIVAIAEHRVKRKYPGSASVLSRLGEYIVGVGGSLFADYRSIHASLRAVKKTDDITPVSEIYLNPYRLYTVQDLAHLTGWDTSTIKVLMISGVLDIDRLEPKKARGDKVRQALPILDGYMPAARVASQGYWNLDWRYSYNFRLDTQLAEYVNSVPYFKNIGKTHPFVLVQAGHEKKFLKFLQEIGVRR